MKYVTEKELNKEFSLYQTSKLALTILVCGVLGALCCVIVFLSYLRLFQETKRDLERMSNLPRLSIEERIAFEEANEERSKSFSRLAVPLFLIANAAWVIGGAIWLYDKKRPTEYPRLKMIGSLLVFATGVICGAWWFILYRQGTA